MEVDLTQQPGNGRLTEAGNREQQVAVSLQLWMIADMFTDQFLCPRNLLLQMADEALNRSPDLTEVMPSNPLVDNTQPKTAPTPPPTLHKLSDTSIAKAGQSSPFIKRFISSSIGKVILGTVIGHLLAFTVLLLNNQRVGLTPDGKMRVERNIPNLELSDPLEIYGVAIAGDLYGAFIGVAIVLIAKKTSFKKMPEIIGLIAGVGVGILLRGGFSSHNTYLFTALGAVDARSLSGGGWAGAILFGAILGLMIGIIFHLIPRRDAV